MAIVIKSNKDGFYRCGIRHSKAPVTYPDGRFTEEELERFQDEPRLSVTITPEVENDDPVPDTAEPMAADPAGGQESDVPPDVLEAARKVVAAGDTIKSGAPDIKAMEKILGRDVDAAERDLAWATVSAENKE